MMRPGPTVALLLLTVACGGSEGTPSKPAPLPNAEALIPVAPAPQPTATPLPGTTPPEDVIPARPPAGGGGGGNTGGGTADASGCGAPVPPPVSRVAVKLHNSANDRATLDSTPLVGPDAAYCRSVGFTDGRSFCPVRPEGHPERTVCEALRVGRASDTGRVGPTWSADGQRCGGSGAASCQNHPDNQFLVFAYGSGTFRACIASGVCGELALP
jgi:hypothetical protein